MTTRSRWAALLVRMVVVAPCSATPRLAKAQGPKRQPPPVQVPATYKTGSSALTLVTGTPALGRADWWTLFGDPTLDDLEARARRANQNTLQATARIEEERLRAQITGADFLPRAEANLTASRERTSNNLPFQRGQLLGTVPSFGTTGTGTSSSANSPSVGALNIQPRTETVNDFRVPLTASYELEDFLRQPVSVLEFCAPRIIPDCNTLPCRGPSRLVPVADHRAWQPLRRF